MDNARQITTLNGSQLDGNLNANGTFSELTEYTNTTVHFTSTNSKPAVEVHRAMRQTYDYYKNIHNRTSFNGNGHSINNYYDARNVLGIHENATAMDEEFGNDFYNGMFYCRGRSLMNPLVSLDIQVMSFHTW